MFVTENKLKKYAGSTVANNNFSYLYNLTLCLHFGFCSAHLNFFNFYRAFGFTLISPLAFLFSKSTFLWLFSFRLHKFGVWTCGRHGGQLKSTFILRPMLDKWQFALRSFDIPLPRPSYPPSGLSSSCLPLLRISVAGFSPLFLPLHPSFL